ncbi:lactonase family protein [Thalassoroseus pseudoceratinae]|uniref:lactonase family protein n=1 Tax=Thalassoroseus pseudoceratinae TaxID=2713176 RepID=UPI001981611C|nr:lactonase family protein [Thalassoroseus pseudoceratinae]
MVPMSFALAVLTIAAGSATAKEPKNELLVYFGTYTRGDSASEGIYLSRLDLTTGELSKPELAAKLPNPSFLEFHPNKKFAYAVSEMANFEGKKTGAVTALAIDSQTGKLTELNRKPSGGVGPCHVSVDAKGTTVFVANYGAGSCASLPIEDDGSLQDPATVMQHEGSSVNPRRQKGPHAHSINLDPANKHAYVCDLGLDQVLIYGFDPNTSELTKNDPPFAKIEPGSGPRHFAFHPNGKTAYINGEMTMTVVTLEYDADTGGMTPVQTLSTMPEKHNGTNLSTAEVRVHPSGKFVYVSNRGHHTIAIFRVNPDTGKLSAVGHASTRGETPRNFNITPDGKFLLAANQDSDDVAVFTIDQETGKLDPVGEPVSVPMPVCVRFLQP